MYKACLVYSSEHNNIKSACPIVVANPTVELSATSGHTHEKRAEEMIVKLSSKKWDHSCSLDTMEIPNNSKYWKYQSRRILHWQLFAIARSFFRTLQQTILGRIPQHLKQLRHDHNAQLQHWLVIVNDPFHRHDFEQVSVQLLKLETNPRSESP